MNEDGDIREFPDVGQKLAAPKKLSAYEKERQTAEAKRLRNEAETAAALREFQNSFGDDDEEEEDDGHDFSRHVDHRGSRPYGSAGGLRGGPGSLGPIPSGPAGYQRKRALDELREQQQAFRKSPPRLFSHGSAGHGSTQRLYENDEDVDQTVPKPTLLLSSLPFGTTKQFVQDLLQTHVDVVDVQMIHPSDRDTHTLSAIATLDTDVLAGKIDSAVSALRDKYVGFGHYLTISRHLTTQGLNSARPMLPTTTKNSLPYGAARRAETKRSLRKAPPPRDYHQFAPPETYTSRQEEHRRMAESVVEVRPPADIQMVRAIHTIANAILSESDPQRSLELEASLMSKEEVQQDERFAFLFDSTSPGGVYYRYLLWRPDHLNEERLRAPHHIDDSYDIEWTSPHEQLPFSDLKDLAQVVDDIDYNSSEEEYDDDDVEMGLNNPTLDPEEASVAARKAAGLLNPLQVARLVSMLADLPTSRARLRNSDVSAITYFAISHAGHGAEEIVDLLLLNVTRPFSSCSAGRAVRSDRVDDGASDDDSDRSMKSGPGETPAFRETRREDDPSDAKLIGLYVISDVLSAASIAGAKNAWKYRQLLESGFRGHRTFAQLGRLDKELKMGRLKAEQWKKRVEHLLGLWRASNMFSVEGQEEIEEAFASPLMTEEELCAQELALKQAALKESSRGEFCACTDESKADSASATVALNTTKNKHDADDIVEDENVDGEPMDEDIDGQPMTDDDEEEIDGTPMETTDDSRQVADANDAGDTRLPGPMPSDPETLSAGKLSMPLSAAARSSTVSQPPKRRMRAEDMFADSDGE